MVTSPYLKPAREPISRCGARVIDSMPPATTILNSPARISWSASAMASSPDRHTLLIVMAGTSIGMPAGTAACRAGICPTPACSTWPMITYSTSDPVRPARSMAPRMATPPSSAAETEARAPLKRPIGVRDPATMTDDMGRPPQVGALVGRGSGHETLRSPTQTIFPMRR